MATFLFMGSNPVGVDTQGYNSGSDGHSIVNTFEVGRRQCPAVRRARQGYGARPARLEEEPPQWLQDMADPLR